MDQLQLPIRNASLYSALRTFVVEGFALLKSDVQDGADVTFSVEAHKATDDAVPLYEYRPSVERFVLERAGRIFELPALRDTAWAVSSDPACNAFLRAGRADAVADLEDVTRKEVLLPLLVTMAELQPDFELDEDALLKSYLRFERTLYSEKRRYAAVVPLWGTRLVYGDLDLAEGVRLRQVQPDLFRMEWPEAAQLNWGEGAVDGLPRVLLEFERVVEADDDESILDPLPALDQVVSVIRALAGGAISAGPHVLERLDHRTLAPRPVPASAARRCGTLPSKIDGTVAKNLPAALHRLAADPHGPTARALERYQHAATSTDLVALRTVFDTLVEIYSDERETSSSGLRIAAVVGASLAERRQFVDAMQTASLMIRTSAQPGDEMREVTRVLAAGLRATIAAALVGELPLSRLRDYADGVLLGERDRRQLGVAAMKPVLQEA